METQVKLAAIEPAGAPGSSVVVRVPVPQAVEQKPPENTPEPAPAIKPVAPSRGPVFILPQ